LDMISEIGTGALILSSTFVPTNMFRHSDHLGKTKHSDAT
jgi:hypothetical protein